MTDAYTPSHGHAPTNFNSPSPLPYQNSDNLEPPDIQTSVTNVRRNGSIDKEQPCSKMPNLLENYVMHRSNSGLGESQYVRDHNDYNSRTLDSRLLQRPLDPRTLENRFDSKTIDSRGAKHKSSSQRVTLDTPIILQNMSSTVDRHGGFNGGYHKLSQQDLCHSQMTISQTNTQPITPETMVPLHSLTDLGMLNYQEGSNEALNSISSGSRPNGSSRPYGMPSSGSANRITQRSLSSPSLSNISNKADKCNTTCGCCKVFMSLLMCLAIFAVVIVALYFFIKYTPNQKMPIAEEAARDPCLLYPCQFGSICVPDGPHNTPACRCPEQCAIPPSLESSNGLRAKEDLTKNSLCASNGKNYQTECQMKIEACQTQKNLVVKYKGLCNPCESLKCSASQVCRVSLDRKPRCDCDDTCASEFDPVCASDGKTYPNECQMRVEGCRNRRTLDIIYRGTCDRGLNPCDSVSCLIEEVCKINSFGVARCECPVRCEPVVVPVCGSDGVTYDNQCELTRTACFQQLEIKTQFVGVCGQDGLCTDTHCQYGAVCVERHGRPVCECPPCPGQLDPVCGSDGLSYNNECYLRAEACTRQTEITVKYKGRCGGCEDKLCKFYAVCEAQERGVGRCVCPNACVDIESPVCGSDGVTYINECQMKVSACRQQKEIRVSSVGDCDLCKHVECRHGARCEAGQCLCPTSCPDTREPVCGNNGKTYLNECMMQRMACSMGMPTLRAAFFGECSEARSSGVNYELIPCNGGSPLRNTNTGRDFYCGEGPDKEECPKGSYCHWSLSFAKCCPLDNHTMDVHPELTGCRASEFLCCPDGVTEALGHNFAGCPSICQCHKLGAYEDTCDPITNQCSCKPGVGGTKCDRCEPGFFGLPMIQRGTDGCLPCGCSLFGSVRDDCEQMTGQCVCKPGIGGKKCNMCPDNLILGPRGCQPESIHATPAPQSCKDLECYFGARCQKQTSGRVQCVCDAQCPSDSSNVVPVCGSDGETYGSECHLKLFACRYQKDVVVERLGPCNMPATLSTEPQREDAKTTRELPVQMSNEIGTILDTPALYSRIKPDTTKPNKPNKFSPEFIKSYSNQGSNSTLSKTPGSIAFATAPSNSFLENFPTQQSELEPTPFSVFGLLGSVCRTDRECSVAEAVCSDRICKCRTSFIASTTRHSCIAQSPGHEATRVNPCSRQPCHGGGTCKPNLTGGFVCVCSEDRTGSMCETHTRQTYQIPSFDGESYMEIKKIKAYNKVQIEVEFRSFSPNGILLYSQQQADGQGDYISLSVVDGFVEFRYNLGSGSAVIRSHHKITPNKFHRVVAKRYQKDGMLQLDGSEDAIGKAPGHLKSLDLRGSTYVGYVPGATKRVFENTGTSEGIVGCIKSIRINGRPLNLLWPGSSHILQASRISDCLSSPCYNLPCENRGSCRPSEETEFKCICPHGYSGQRCEARLDPCSNFPCEGGGSCVALPDMGYMCHCPPGRSGLICDIVDQTVREVVVPEFDGDSYLELPTLENVGTSFAIEIWFLATSTEGVLLYNGQGSGGGDFVALNLRKGHVEFIYNLGSGHSRIVSAESVELDKWHVVQARRNKRRGTLRLDHGERVRGMSGHKMVQLNLNQKLFLGGLMNYSSAHADARICCGFSGAIQRLIINREIMEDIPSRAIAGKGVRKYRGLPCHPNMCLNGGICQPFLDRFVCRCPNSQKGKFCEKQIEDIFSSKAVSFDGQSYLQFNDIIKRIPSHTDRLSNHFSMQFMTQQKEGLLLWASKGGQGDYIALAVVGGVLELSFKLDKDQNFFSVKSKVTVSDGEWHTVVAYRRKRLGIIRVDRERPVKGSLENGSGALKTNGTLFIGGAPSLPKYLPSSYYKKFNGCIDQVEVYNRDLNIMSHDGEDKIQFCDSLR